MILRAKYTTAGMTAQKLYEVIPQGGLLIKDHMVKILLDDGKTMALRLFNAFDVAYE